MNTESIAEPPDVDSSARGDLLVWWTSQEECEAIGAYPPGSVPGYIRAEYRSRLGRNGRGRLWVDAQFGPVGIPWDTSRPAVRLTEMRGGIVIWATDAAHVFALPGFLTDLRLNFVNVVEGVEP